MLKKTILLITLVFSLTSLSYAENNRTVSLRDGSVMKVSYNLIEKWSADCKKGDGDACYKVGRAWSDHNAVEFIDMFESYKYMKIGCQKKNGEACFCLGKKYSKGIGTIVNANRAIKSLECAVKKGAEGAEEELEKVKHQKPTKSNYHL